MTIEQKRQRAASDEPLLTWARRCALLGLSLSTYYYQAKTNAEEERFMRLLDQHYLQYPYEGKIKRARWLSQPVGYTVGKKRVATLMKKLGVSTLYPKPATSGPDKQHEVYPYLLKDTDMIRPNQVWSLV